MTVEFESNGEALARQIADGVAAGLTAAAEWLLALSRKDVPFDLGTLSNSGVVLPATTPEDGAAVTFNTPYAARLHEHPEFNFQGGRKGKYVEDPALQNREELRQIVEAEANRATGAWS